MGSGCELWGLAVVVGLGFDFFFRFFVRKGSTESDQKGRAKK